jgi:hypothetical protein
MSHVQDVWHTPDNFMGAHILHILQRHAHHRNTSRTDPQCTDFTYRGCPSHNRQFQKCAHITCSVPTRPGRPARTTQFHEWAHTLCKHCPRICGIPTRPGRPARTTQFHECAHIALACAVFPRVQDVRRTSHKFHARACTHCPRMCSVLTHPGRPAHTYNFMSAHTMPALPSHMRHSHTSRTSGAAPHNFMSVT